MRRSYLHRCQGAGRRKNISNERVFAIEGEIDQLEHDIESLCMRMLLQQQPVASDLRVISAALKMISDMERIGDQAADIAELCPYVGPQPGAGQTTHHQYGKGSGFDGHRKRGSICTGRFEDGLQGGTGRRQGG